MAEPYKRKTRYPGLKEHERLQKQKKADAKKAAKKAAERAKKRLKRMKPSLKLAGPITTTKDLMPGETNGLGTHDGPVSGKPLTPEEAAKERLKRANPRNGFRLGSLPPLMGGIGRVAPIPRAKKKK